MNPLQKIIEMEEKLNEYSHSRGWEVDVGKTVIDATPEEIKSHITQTIKTLLEAEKKEIESIDIEENRKLYGTDFAAGMDKMKNIHINTLEEVIKGIKNY